MKYSFFLAILLANAFPAASALTDETIVVWEEDTVTSRPISKPLTPHKLWTLSEAQNWMTSPPVKKAWPAFFKVLQEIPTPDYVRKGRADLCQGGALKITLEIPSISTWYKGATVSSGKSFITHAGLIQSSLNSGSLLKGLRQANNTALLPLILTLE
ncbi:hypothetical protein OAN21_02750 [Alphaproteobacteria bacterium]|nr:hypothetical protein [Alphaproteobacteria bacterium]